MIRPIIYLYYNLPINYLQNEEFTDVVFTWDEVSTKYLISSYGRVYSKNRNALLQPTPDKDGYLHYNLSGNNGRRYNIGAHRLVLLSFCIVQGYELLVVNHKDGNKQNNWIENLEWCTQAENAHHAAINNFYYTCDDHPRATLTDADVHQICKYLEQGKTYNEIYVLMNIPEDEIPRFRYKLNSITSGNSWTTISQHYNISNSLHYNTEYTADTINDIGRCLEAGMSYEDICNSLSIPAGELKKFKKFLYSLVYYRSFDEILSQYDIKKPISEKEPLFTSEEINIICKLIVQGRDSAYIYKFITGCDLDTLDTKKKHCIVNCISNIKTKKSFTAISNNYF